MYSTKQRMNLVIHRARAQQAQRQSRQITQLGILCGVLLCAQVALIGHLCEGGRYYGAADWFYGAMLLGGTAGGYLLVSLIAFVAAAIVVIAVAKIRAYRATKDMIFIRRRGWK